MLGTGIVAHGRAEARGQRGQRGCGVAGNSHNDQVCWPRGGEADLPQAREWRCRPAFPVTAPAMCRASRTAYGSLVADWVSIRAASPWRRRKHRSAEPQDHAERVRMARRRQRRAALDGGARQRAWQSAKGRGWQLRKGCAASGWGCFGGRAVQARRAVLSTTLLSTTRSTALLSTPFA